jgi:hypothetical protein
LPQVRIGPLNPGLSSNPDHAFAPVEFLGYKGNSVSDAGAR